MVVLLDISLLVRDVKKASINSCFFYGQIIVNFEFFMFLNNNKCYNIFGDYEVNNKIANVLKMINEAGYEAYVVGGFVRDYILGKETYDVDITTSAEPKVIKEIFNLSNDTKDNYGSVLIKDKLYNYDITTYRKELKYEDRKPIEFEYTDSIEEDVKRRDFTINSLFMDVNGKITDLVGGKEDLENGVIRVIGNINDKMVEDPLRILRAVRFASTLGFDLDSKLKQYIIQNKQLLQTLSYSRKKEELDKIFKDQNKLRGIQLLKELNLCDILEIEISENVVDSSNPIGIWAQISFSDNYQFKNSDLELIDTVKKIINYGIIDNVVLYEYGLYASVIAGEILNINRSYISSEYKELPIYSQKDIMINGDEIINLLNIEPGSIIKDIISDVEISILNNIIPNENEAIKQYILDNWR